MDQAVSALSSVVCDQPPPCRGCSVGLGFSPDRSEVLQTSVNIDGAPARVGGGSRCCDANASFPDPFHTGVCGEVHATQLQHVEKPSHEEK